MSKPMTYWSVSSQVLKEEAEMLGLTVEILVPEKNLFIIKGNGKEVLFKSTDFGVNSYLAGKIADDKELTYTLLQRYNLPIAKTLYIYEDGFESFNWDLLNNFHFPVIIKPTNEDHGNGVCMNITSVEELKRKLISSFEDYPKIIIQEQVSGNECRVLVVLGEVIVALHRIPPYVTGNGISTIQQLIDHENLSNSLRKDDYNAPLGRIRIDSELVDFIGKQGYTVDSVPPKDLSLQIRGNSNLGTGGTVEDVTSILHEDTKKLCILAAEKLGLGMGGIDILTSDFSKPLSETGGVILEVNATPGIGGDRELTPVNTGREMLKKIFGII